VLDQFMSVQVSQVRTGYAMFGQVMTYCEILFKVRSGEALLPHVRQVWSRLGKVMIFRVC
jgi:hypothetical protein